MKRGKLLFVLPALLLFSCGGASEASSSEMPKSSSSLPIAITSLEPSSSPSSEPAKSSSEESSSSQESQSSSSKGGGFSSKGTSSIEETSSLEESTSSSLNESSNIEESSIVISEELSSSEEEISSSEEELSSSEEEVSSSEEEISSNEEESSSASFDYDSLYDGYYSAIKSWTDGEDLKKQLHDVIHGETYTPITYAGTITNWASNSNADQDLYDHEMVDAVYTSSPILKTDTQAGWQREHAFCASLMTGSPTSNAVKTLGRATDYHNLFAGSNNGNTSRGNKNYGTADKTAPTYTDRTVKNGKDGYSYDSTWFEPAEKDKGRLARAIFYMATMYCEEEYDATNGIAMKGLSIVEENVPYVAGDKCAFSIGGLSSLLSWSELPVDLMEYQHNESVYSFAPEVHSNPENNVAQGNRNPYVDFPGLVDYVYGEKKNEAGQIEDVVPSCLTLGIGEEGTSHYAIKQAKRRYDDGEAFHKDDVEVIAISKSFEEAPYEFFSVIGAEDGKEIEPGGNVTLTVSTPINDISYDVLVETDPIESATWKHNVTAKSAGNDFSGIATENGVTHTLNFDDVAFDVTFAKGSVQSNSAALGCKFGTSAAPVESLTFTTHDSFSFDGKSQIEALYVRGAAAANTSCDVAFYVGETLIGTKALSYPGQNLTMDIGVDLDNPLEGKISFAFYNIKNAIYVKTLAVHAT